MCLTWKDHCENQFDHLSNWECGSIFLLNWSILGKEDMPISTTKLCLIRGKETNKSLTVEAIVANSCSTVLIFFFKSSISEFEDEKVWVTTSAIFCWLSRIFERTWFCATSFSACQFKVGLAEETCHLVPSRLVPIGFLIFQSCFVLVWGWSKLSRGGKFCE